MKQYLILGLCFIILNISGNAQSQQSGKFKTIQVEAQRRLFNSGDVKYTPYESFETRTVDLLSGYKTPNELPKLSKYGGWLNHRTNATGFFYAKKMDDRWWCVDPEGYLYINVALNSITMGKSERNEKAITEKFGNPKNWIRETIGLLQENGFNCAGSWSDTKAITEANKSAKRPFAYTINWNFMSSYGRERGGTFQQAGHMGYPKDVIFVFDPEFETFCDRHAR